ncbi:NADP-dependent oxidoreductase domain-containing protein [Haematococcus lacustris]
MRQHIAPKQPSSHRKQRLTQPVPNPRPRCPSLRAMEQRQLGCSSLSVPVLCFGTMLFGESTSSDKAMQLMDACMDMGMHFFDTAEMYPVPQRGETSGDSERIIGQWMRQRGVPRQSVVLATKVCGPSGQMTWIRGGPHKVDRANILAAIEGSLTRLGTDYIDLLQLHWPDRYVPMFGDLDYDPHRAYSGTVPLEEQLEAVGLAITQGKVRHLGLSNETPYGLTRACLAGRPTSPPCSSPSASSSPSSSPSFSPSPLPPSPSPHPSPAAPIPPVTALQNALSLICRTFTTAGGCAEVCHAQGVGMLAYSPLAMGLLTGKYLDPGGGPPEARLNKYRGRYAEAESRYGPRPNVAAAVAAYCQLAHNAGITPTAMAIRWVVHQPLVTSAVIGATSTLQLREQVQAVTAGPLPQDVLDGIDAIHALYPNPTP